MLLSSFGHRCPPPMLREWCPSWATTFPQFPFSPCLLSLWPWPVQLQCFPRPGNTCPQPHGEALAFPGALGGESTLHVPLSSMKGSGIYTDPHEVIWTHRQTSGEVTLPPPTPTPLLPHWWVGNFEILSSLLHKGSQQDRVPASGPW